MKWIRVRGAREHNLKNIDVDLPKEHFIVITGVSGSGKSSLAFDTLYAEGQRRYVESLSAYVRQFLELMSKPEVDSIEGISPVISIEQKTFIRNPRSIIATTTEIYDYMRVLWARIGIPYSPVTGLPIESQSVSQMVESILMFPEGTVLYVLAPVVRGRKVEYTRVFQDLLKRGYQRVKVDKTLYHIEDVPRLDKKRKHDIDVVVDRITVHPHLGNRLADSLEIALHLADGVVVLEDVQKGTYTTLSSKFACPVSGFTLSEIEPRLFSFNNPYGACPECKGLGEKYVFEEETLVVDKQRSLSQGVFPGIVVYFCEKEKLQRLLKKERCTIETPWVDVPEEVQKEILYGDANGAFEGLIPMCHRLWHETDGHALREALGAYLVSHSCSKCQGTRLRSEALTVKVDEYTIAQASHLTIKKALIWFEGLPHRLSVQHQTIAERILREIQARLRFLNDLGIGYLNLNRASRTLSGGESQRLRLASQLGSALTGILYILDEPSIGVHPRDNDQLLSLLRRLRDLGNTVVVIEHDEEMIRCADWVIDMGLGAGKHGGEVIVTGPPDRIQQAPESLTGQYLQGVKSIPIPQTRRSGHVEQVLELRQARTHNLKNITLRIPLGTFTCITGISGSGKSTLLLDTLYKILAQRLHRAQTKPGEYTSIEGVSFIDKVIEIDQAPIGRTPRSNPVTYTGIFKFIREWYTKLPQARQRGYSVGRFSFNVKGGRCEACQGHGVVKVAMHFLPDLQVVCEECKGQRYNRETLEILYKNHSIADILRMTVIECMELFEHIPLIVSKLKILEQVGLGYMTLGQSATTLSGGEAQRIKLAKELSQCATGRTLYILDEPTTGLHFDDVKKLLEVLHCLVEQGNTVVVIEHNLHVIKTADWIVDLGPEAREDGGYIIAEGRPEDIVQCEHSYTGRYLKPYLKS